MKKTLRVTALAMPMMFLIGCGANDARTTGGERLADEVAGLEVETLPAGETDVILPISPDAHQDLDPVHQALLQEDTLTEDAMPAENQTAPDMAEQPELMQFHFSSDQYVLLDDDLTELTHHARYLLSHPDMKLKITGHTDQSGSDEYNRRLGMKRADYVAKLLVQQGVPPERISIHSAGETRATTGLEHAVRDRRVEFEYASELQLSDQKVY